MHKGLRLLCGVVFAAGVLMLVLAAVQAAGVGNYFDTPPWITGSALAAIGGTMLAGDVANRRKQKT